MRHMYQKKILCIHATVCKVVKYPSSGNLLLQLLVQKVEHDKKRELLFSNFLICWVIGKGATWKLKYRSVF